MARRRKSPKKPSPPAAPAEPPATLAAGTPDPAAIRAVIQWFTEGRTEADIAADLAKHFADQPARPIFDAAFAHFEANTRVPRDILNGFFIEAYRDLYRKTLDVGNYDIALKSLAKLQATIEKLPTDPDPLDPELT